MSAEIPDALDEALAALEAIDLGAGGLTVLEQLEDALDDLADAQQAKTAAREELLDRMGKFRTAREDWVAADAKVRHLVSVYTGAEEDPS